MTQFIAVFGTSVLFGVFGLYAVLRRGCPGPDQCASSDCKACGWAEEEHEA